MAFNNYGGGKEFQPKSFRNRVVIPGAILALGTLVYFTGDSIAKVLTPSTDKPVIEVVQEDSSSSSSGLYDFSNYVMDNIIPTPSPEFVNKLNGLGGKIESIGKTSINPDNYNLEVSKPNLEKIVQPINETPVIPKTGEYQLCTGQSYTLDDFQSKINVGGVSGFISDAENSLLTNSFSVPSCELTNGSYTEALRMLGDAKNKNIITDDEYVNLTQFTNNIKGVITTKN